MNYSAVAAISSSMLKASACALFSALCFILALIPSLLISSRDANAGEGISSRSLAVTITVVDSLEVGGSNRASSGAEVIVLTDADQAVITYVVLD